MDLNLLPEDLRNISLSKSEIVLDFTSIFKALDFLLLSNKGVLGYEVWFKYPNGISHFLNVGGKTIVDSSLSLERNKDENWEDYVIRTNSKYKDLIMESNGKLKEISEKNSVMIYYCLTVCNENET